MTFHTWTTKGVSKHNSKEGDSNPVAITYMDYICITNT